MALAFSLAGGWEIFAGFIVLMTIAVIYGTYSRRGSGISQRPYHRRYGDAPGAHGGSRISGREGIASMSSRGTKRK